SDLRAELVNLDWAIVLSLFAPVVIAYFIISFDLYWMIKSLRLSVNLIRGYRRLHEAQKVDWNKRLDWLRDPEGYLERTGSRYRPELQELVDHKRLILDPDEIYNAVILATYNESLDIL